MTFVVKRIDDRLVKTSLPGQYVTVQVPMPDGVRQPRQYSLTRADDGEHRQFSVKRVHGGGKPDGEVSNLLLRRGRRGRRRSPCRCPSATSCSTTPAARWCSPAPASGSPRWPGCCRTSSRPARDLPITLLHADVDEASFALRRQVARATSVALPRRLASTSGTSSGADSNEPVDGVHAGHDGPRRRSTCPTTPRYYLCGPLPFMQAVRSALIERGVPPRDIQYEVFGPDLWQADLD